MIDQLATLATVNMVDMVFSFLMAISLILVIFLFTKPYQGACKMAGREVFQKTSRRRCRGSHAVLELPATADCDAKRRV